MKFTKTTISKLELPADKKQIEVWDDVVEQFGVRVYENRKTFFIRYFNDDGRRRQMKIGTFGQLSVDKARQLAKQKLGEVAGGEDPAERRTRRAEAVTIDELCDLYVNKYAKLHKKTWAKDESRLDRYVKPAWGQRKARSITRADVINLHAEIGEHAKTMANRVHGIVRKMFNWGVDYGALPGDHENPASGIPRFKEKTRDVFLDGDQVKALAKAIDAEGELRIRCLVWLYLLTGCRKSELLRLKWEDVSLTRQELTIRETKNDETHTVPLTPAAASLVETLWKHRDKKEPYVFPGDESGTHRKDFKRQWRRIRKNAGFVDENGKFTVRLHDLRRTLGSWMAQSGASLHLIGKTLNHKSPTATRIYARLSQDPVRKALADESEKLLAAAGKTEVADVVELDEVKGAK